MFLFELTTTLLIKWKVNLRNFPANSETGTPCIDIKTFELTFQLHKLSNRTWAKHRGEVLEIEKVEPKKPDQILHIFTELK